MREHLIIFTRYPIAGQTKTRLIPALGAAGAADLQRQLTEFTLRQVRSLTQDISIYFSGGNLAQMQHWLGSSWQYQPQTGTNLGDRLSNAFQQSVTQGYQSTVIIGIDCPELNPEILQAAFANLQDHDLVLGKAHDGGYYLIGLQHNVNELFTEMRWGTDQVFAETLRRSQSLNLKTKILPTLHDIDYPEDLATWERINKT